MSLYPLIFKPILIGKPWGGSRLEQVFGRAPAGPRLAAPIGESWDLADFDDARSVIANGPFEGRTLSNVIEEFGEALMGTLALDERTGGFPLLVKFINSAKHLSIQVHPDARYARDHPEARSKNEAWYIIEADPGAVIYRGLNRAHEKDEIRRLVQTSDL